jgi:hypothetical protein
VIRRTRLRATSAALLLFCSVPPLRERKSIRIGR